MAEQEHNNQQLTQNFSISSTSSSHSHQWNAPVLLTYPLTTVVSQNKSYGSLELIKMALVNNELFRNFEPYCISHIAEQMEYEEYLDGDVIIQECSPGGKLYVVEYGMVQVCRNGASLCYIPAGKLFGELALLFKWQHSVTFKAASSPCQLWTLEGDMLEQILKHGWKRHSYVQFMTFLPLFKHLPENKLIRLSWQIGEQEYMHGEYIIKQGTHANNFFVIQRGRVKVTIKQREVEKFVRVMYQGDFFGEKALLSQQQHQLNCQSSSGYQADSGDNVVAKGTTSGGGGVRTANVIVDDENGVTCLVIDRQAFYQFFRGLEQQVARQYINE